MVAEGMFPLDLVQGYTLDLCAPSSTPVHPTRDPHDTDGRQGPCPRSAPAQAETLSASQGEDPEAEAPGPPTSAPDVLASRDSREHQRPQDPPGHSQKEIQEAVTCGTCGPTPSERSSGGAEGSERDPPERYSSILGAVYLAGKGPRERVVGATRRAGVTPEEAWRECGRVVERGREWDAAVDALLPAAEAVWAPAGTWEVRRVRTGVRALSPRTAEGSAPLAGRVPVPGKRYVPPAGPARP